MLENLQMARPGQQMDSDGDDDMMSALDELGDMIRKQQQLRDRPSSRARTSGAASAGSAVSRANRASRASKASRATRWATCGRTSRRCATSSNTTDVPHNDRGVAP